MDQAENVQENLVMPQAFRGGGKKSPGRLWVQAVSRYPLPTVWQQISYLNMIGDLEVRADVENIYINRLDKRFIASSFPMP